MEITPSLSTFQKAVSAKLSFSLSKPGLEKIVRSLLIDSSVWITLWKSRQPIRAVLETLSVLQKNGLVSFKKDEVIFTKKGEIWIKSLNLSPLPSFVCTCCEGRGIEIDKLLLKEFIELQKNRPEPLQDFGQAYVTAQTTIARVMHAVSNGDIDKKEIVVLGAEDDLLGLALALSKRPKKVIVLEIDKRIVDFDNKLAKKLSLPLEARIVDLQQKLSKNYIGKFDTFFTDPPETIPAIKGFILKGVATLKEEGAAGYFGFTMHDSSLEKWFTLQKTLIENKCVTTDILPDFNAYHNFSYLENTPASSLSSLLQYPPNKNWFHSHWFRIVATKGFKRINQALDVGRSLYNDTEAASY